MKKNALTLAAGSLSLLANQPPRDPKMRYSFHVLEDKPGFVLVFDHKIQQAAAELVEEHAQVIYLMYKNLHGRLPVAADEFMYGHILGWTYTMIHADKYPRIHVEKGPNGRIVKVIDRQSGEVLPEGDASAAFKEMKDRVDPEGKVDG